METRRPRRVCRPETRRGRRVSKIQSAPKAILSVKHTSRQPGLSETGYNCGKKRRGQATPPCNSLYCSTFVGGCAEGCCYGPGKTEATPASLAMAEPLP